MNTALVWLSNGRAAAVESASRYAVGVHGRPRVASSGVLWKPGVVVTAEHTLRRDDDLRVTLPDGRTVSAELAGRDGGTDLAVLKVSDQQEGAATDETGDLNAGAFVLAVGRSQDTGVIASLGIISSVSGPWHTWRGGLVDRVILLYVALYPGSSGGAVANAAGKDIRIRSSGLFPPSDLKG